MTQSHEYPQVGTHRPTEVLEIILASRVLGWLGRGSHKPFLPGMLSLVITQLLCLYHMLWQPEGSDRESVGVLKMTYNRAFCGYHGNLRLGSP